MPYLILEGAKTPVKVWVDDLNKVETSALDQIRGTANLPWVEGVAIMPDVHFGIGATIGSVIMNKGAVSPSVVGVDIGCGMMAVVTPYKAGQLKNLSELRHSIERSVPVGFNEHKEITPRIHKGWDAVGTPSDRIKKYEEKALKQLGTLGGGNHFIEICVDGMENVWVMLHSGSRHLGNVIAKQHIETAKGLMREQVDALGIDKDLAALLEGTPEFNAYLQDVMFCQAYAKANRREMMVRVLKDLSFHLNGEDIGSRNMIAAPPVECHHNYIEDMGNGLLLTRKGAVSAKHGELGIIPGSMGARSFIVMGRGSEDSFCSCSHGAGRRMSRGAAKRAFTETDLISQTEGVECRKDVGVLDEIPGAYKDIDEVMRNQRDLVDIVATLRQVICVKG